MIWPGGEITKMNQIKTNQKIDVDVEKLGGKIDKIYWVLLTVAGSAVLWTSRSLYNDFTLSLIIILYVFITLMLIAWNNETI